MPAAPPPPRTPHSSDEAIGVTRLRPRPEFDRLFDALADVERLRLLEALTPLSRPAGELASRLGRTRDGVVKQLKLLERVGLVASARNGRRVLYVLTPAKLWAMLTWSCDLWVTLPAAGLEPAEDLSLERRAVLAGALRAPGRRDMLECMCRGGPISQGAAASDCGLSQGLASRGLAMLVEAGLVTVHTTGRHHRYRASPPALGALVRWLRAAVDTAERAEAQEQRLREAREARAAERRQRLVEKAGLNLSAESANLPSGMSDVVVKRSRKQGRQLSPPDIRQLDGVFAVFADEDDCRIASAVCEGVVTGGDLADKLGWPRDKVSRRLIRLAQAGVVEKRQAGPYVRATPIVAGLVSAQAWLKALRVGPASRDRAEADPQLQRRRCEALADPARRSLVEHIVASPGATQAELFHACGLPQAVASRGVARLRTVGLVEVRPASAPALYVVGATAVEELWAWSERAKAKLAAGRVTASRKVLTPRAPRGAPAAPGAPSPASRAAPLPPPHAKKAAADGSPALLDGVTRLAAGSRHAPDVEREQPLDRDGSTRAKPDRASEPMVRAIAPSATVVSPAKLSGSALTTPRAPRPALARVADSLEPDDLRPGQCFACRDGSQILLLTHNYGVFEYARSAADGAPVTKGAEPRHLLADRFTMAVDPAAFPKERIPR